MNAPSANVRWITDRRGLVRLFLLLVILSTSVQVLPGASLVQPVLAAGTPCVESGPSSGSYVARLCFTSPADGSTFTAAEFTANVTVTSVVGTLPPITKVQFTLNVSTGATHPTFMTDYLAPWTTRVPTTHWKDGTYRLDARVTFSDSFTSTYANVIVGFATGTAQDQHSNGSWSPATSGASTLNLVAVGDGAGGLPGAAAVGNLVSSMNPDLFLYLGDVYNSGSYGEYYNYYEPTLGALKGRTNPVIGNHETGDNLKGYMDYWNASQHYYSFNSGGWHFIALDATTQFDQTAAGSAQYNWLAQDLATTDPNSCTMVFYHQPRWGLDGAGGNAYLQDIWSLMAMKGVDVVLNGHEHNYQRWNPMDANGAQVAGGMVEYVIGTGGHEQMGFAFTDNRVAYRAKTDGAMKLSLTSTGGTSAFSNTSGAVLDTGSFTCDGSAVPVPPPDPNEPLTLAPVADAMVQAANPDTNYGTVTNLRADTSPNEMSYLRFNVAGVTQPITKATLRLWVRDGTTNAPEIAPCSDITWNERGITWNNKPAIGSPVTTTGQVLAGNWVEYDVTSLITGNGQFSLALTPQSSDALSVNSRDNADSTPQLVILQTGSVEPPPDEETATFKPVADAKVVQTSPTTNYGTINSLSADSPDVMSYLRFNVQGVTQPVTKATLRMLVRSGSSDGTANAPEIASSADVTWSETGINWNNKPATGAPVTSKGAAASGTWVEYDVTSLVTGNGLITLAMVPDSSDAMSVNSRNNTDTSIQPQLVVQHSGSTEPPPPPPPDPGAPITLEPVADAMVVQASADANYGSAEWLHTDLAPDEMSFLRFNVQGVTSPVSQATLRLWVRSGTVNGPEVASCADVTWIESAITWNNKPACGAVTTTTGNVPTGTWLEYNVTSLITGNGLVTLALVPQSSDGLSLDSREVAVTRPQLVIQQSTGSTAAEASPEATPATPVATPATPVATPATPVATPATPATPVATPATPVATPATPVATPATPEATPPVSSEPVTFVPVADAMVVEANPNANLGLETALHADQSPLEMSYLRFDVQGVAEPVTQATLRLWVRSGTADGPEVAGSSDVGWSETGITWNNKPVYGPLVTSTGIVPTGVWLEYDVSSLVTGNGLVTFALVGESNDGISLSSREDATEPPQLIIGGSGGGTGEGDEPPATPDATPGTSATPDATPDTPDSGPPPDSDGDLTFGAQADAMVALANPDMNYGTSASLHADQSPEEMSYLRFDVQGVSEPVTQATLRLWVRSGTANGPEVASCADVTWSETTITWNTKPECGSPVTVTGGIDSGVWVEYDVTSLITGNGLVTLGLIPDSGDLLSVNSRRSTSNPPELIVSTASGAQGLRAALPIASPGATEPEIDASPVADASPAPVEVEVQQPGTGSPVAASPESTGKQSLQEVEQIPTAAASPVEADTPETAPPQQSTFGTVINTGEDGLRCRTEPSLDSDVIAVLANGEQVAVRGDPVDGWIPVTCAGEPGYVAADYLQLTTGEDGSTVTDGTSGALATVEPTATTEQPGTPEPATEEAVDVVPTATVEPTIEPTGPVVIGIGYVTGTNGDGVRCRIAASVDADVIGVLEEGSEVSLLGDAVDGWLPVLCNDGQPGYVAAGFVSVNGVALGDGTTPPEVVAEPIEVPIPTETATVEAQPTEEIVTEPPTPTEIVPTEVPEPEPYSIYRIKDSEQSDTGWKLTDEDATTYWTITPSISPDDVWLQIDLGEELPVDRVSWQLARSGFLPYTEIWLSADGETWWNADQFNGWNLEADTDYESALGVWTRYILFVIPDPVESGLTEFGGFSKIEVWPADDAQSVDTYATLVTPEPPPEPEIEPTAIPTEPSTEEIEPTDEPAVEDSLPTEEPPVEDVVPTEAPPVDVDDLDPAPTDEVVPDDESSSGRVVDNQDGSEESSDGG